MATYELDVDAAFFVEDMVLNVLGEGGHRWATPRIDLPEERPENLLYSFTPEMGHFIMWLRWRVQGQYATERPRQILRIAYTEARNRCSFIYELFHNRYDFRYTEEMPFQVYWVVHVGIFMLISTDLCCYFYTNGQLDIVRDILIASEMIISDVMGMTPVQRFALLQEYAELVRDASI